MRALFFALIPLILLSSLLKIKAKMSIETITRGAKITFFRAVGSLPAFGVIQLTRGFDGVAVGTIAAAELASALFAKEELWVSDAELQRRHSDKRQFLLIHFAMSNIASGFAVATVATTAFSLLSFVL